MWNDLNMRDRHKFIKLAVTNGVYDLDTIHDLYDRKPNMYAIGGETAIQTPIPTDPNRPQIDVKPIIDRIRAERLARYTAPDSALAQIKELTDNIRENEFRREFAEWINPTRNTNDYVDIKRTVPVAEARPTFINTYELGGPEDPPKYSYQWQDDSQKYVKPSNGTQGTSSEVFSFDNPMDPWNRFNYNQGNYIKSGILTDAISLGLMAAPTIAPYIAEGLASPITTVASQIPQLGKYSYMLPTLDKALWAATGASGLYNRVSNEGVQGITNHPFLTAMDLGMLSPVAKGIKTVGNEAVWKYTSEIPKFNNYRNVRPAINNDILGQEIKWENIDNPLKGASNDKDFYKEMMKSAANNYISGEPYFYSIFGKPQLAKGLSKEYQEHLLNNTIGRTINYLKEEKGLDEIGAKNIYDIAKQQLKDVQIGRFSKANYELAGQKNFAGFYNPRNNFISVRTDIPEKQTILHEGRHMLDYNMPITLPKKHKEILNEAYGEDFINIPKTKYAEGLKDYSYMNREMVTTNLDARNKLLGNLDDLSIEQQNSIIDKAGDNVIINAIEGSNGYGRRYINYLRDSGLLTKEKIQKFRNAMKYVGSFGLPTGLYLGTRNNE